MATTVEEILVKFTGDASGLANASDKAKNKTKSLSDEIVKLNSLLEHLNKTKPGTQSQADAMERLEKAARKYAEALEKISKQEKKENKPKGERDNVVERGLSSFIQAARRQIAYNAIQAGEAVILKATQDWIGWTQAIRDNNKALYEAEVIQKGRLQLIGDQQAQVGRDVSMLKNPFTGAPDIEAERKRREQELKVLTEQQKQSNITKARLEKEIATVDEEGADEAGNMIGRRVRKQFTKGQIAKIPFVGEPEKIEIEAANKALDEQRAKHEKINEAIHAQREALKDIDKLGSALERETKRLQIENETLSVQERAIGLTQEQARLNEDRHAVAEAIRKSGKVEAEELEKVVALLDQKAQRIQEIGAKQAAQQKLEKEVNERTQMDERLRRDQFSMAGRGFKGVEAEVLARNAEGKQRGNKELLQNAYTLEADALNQKYMPASQKAQIEMARLNALKEKGVLTAEAYDRAMTDVAKTIGGDGGRASPRQATLAGSAEQFARVDEYSRMMEQPKADSAALDRAAKERDPTVKAIREGNQILNKILAGQGKEGVTIKPANVEN